MGRGVWEQREGGAEEEDGSHRGNGGRTRTGESGVIWRQPIGGKWCDERSGFNKTGIAAEE